MPTELPLGEDSMGKESSPLESIRDREIDSWSSQLGIEMKTQWPVSYTHLRAHET